MAVQITEAKNLRNVMSYMVQRIFLDPSISVNF